MSLLNCAQSTHEGIEIACNSAFLGMRESASVALFSNLGLS